MDGDMGKAADWPDIDVEKSLFVGILEAGMKGAAIAEGTDGDKI